MRKSGPEVGYVIGGCRKVHSEKYRNLCFSQNIKVTEQSWCSDNFIDFCSGYSRFESHLEHRLSCPGFFVVFPISSPEMLR
jgi:hypothetical protein